MNKSAAIIDRLVHSKALRSARSGQSIDPSAVPVVADVRKPMSESRCPKAAVLRNCAQKLCSEIVLRNCAQKLQRRRAAQPGCWPTVWMPTAVPGSSHG